MHHLGHCGLGLEYHNELRISIYLSQPMCYSKLRYCEGVGGGIDLMFVGPGVIGLRGKSR